MEYRMKWKSTLSAEKWSFEHKNTKNTLILILLFSWCLFSIWAIIPHLSSRTQKISSWFLPVMNILPTQMILLSFLSLWISYAFSWYLINEHKYTYSLLFLFKNGVCMCVTLLVCMYTRSVLYPKRPKEGIKSKELESMLWATWYGFWEPNPHLLQQ